MPARTKVENAQKPTATLDLNASVHVLEESNPAGSTRRVDNPPAYSAKHAQRCKFDSGFSQEVENNVPATLRNDGVPQSSTGMVVLALASMDSPMGALACRRAIPGPAATGTIFGTPTLVLAQTYDAEVPTIWHLSKCLQDGKKGLTTRVTGLEPTGYGVHRNHLSALLSVRLLVSNWTGQSPRTP